MYTAFSRVRTANSIRVVTGFAEEKHRNWVTNIVYKEILQTTETNRFENASSLDYWIRMKGDETILPNSLDEWVRVRNNELALDGAMDEIVNVEEEPDEEIIVGENNGMELINGGDNMSVDIMKIENEEAIDRELIRQVINEEVAREGATTEDEEIYSLEL